MAGLSVLYWIPYPTDWALTAGSTPGWRAAFEDLGHTVHTLTSGHNWRRTIEAIRPDLLFCPNFADLPRQRETLRWARASGVCVFLVVDWPMRHDDVAVLRHDDVADVYFCERERESMGPFEVATGKRSQLIPNAADRTLHMPAPPDPRYSYDVVYLGAKLPKKRAFFENVLLPLRKRYKVGVFGPGWTARDRVLRAAQAASRWIGATRLADAANAKRVTVPPNEENVLYSSAAIALNAHERESDGSQPHYIVNQRAFKIPACGGFEICDEVPPLREYFSSCAAVTATNRLDWIEKIDYYLNHPAERERSGGLAVPGASGAHLPQSGTSRARTHGIIVRIARVAAKLNRAARLLAAYRRPLRPLLDRVNLLRDGEHPVEMKEGSCFTVSVRLMKLDCERSERDIVLREDGLPCRAADTLFAEIYHPQDVSPVLDRLSSSGFSTTLVAPNVVPAAQSESSLPATPPRP